MMFVTCLISIIAFIIIITLIMYSMLWSLWSRSKESHKKEYVDLYFFVFDRFFKTGIYFPRCYTPIFNVFQKKKIGFCFMAVNVVVMNEEKKLLLCEINSSKRYENVKYDIGAGGMVAMGESLRTSAVREIEEELGFVVEEDKLISVRYVTPAGGYHCVVHIYVLKITDEVIDFDKSDGTYIGYSWVSREDLCNKYGENIVKADQYLNATTYLTLYSL
jgi:ADP-ribose pyrophosphatase YjhB (NUDIX family)